MERAACAWQSRPEPVRQGVCPWWVPCFRSEDAAAAQEKRCSASGLASSTRLAFTVPRCFTRSGSPATHHAAAANQPVPPASNAPAGHAPAERLIAPDVPPPLPLPAPLPIADRQRNPKAKFALVLGVIIVATAIIGGRSLTSGATVSATSFSMPSRTDMHNSIALATTHAKLVVLPAFANAAVAASNTTQALAAPALAQLRSWWAAATSSQSSIERELEATKAELAKAQALAASLNLSLAVLPPEKPNHPAGGGRHRSQTRDSAKGDRGGPSVAAVLFTGIIVGAAGRKLFYELARPNPINDPTTQGWVHVDY